MCCPWQVVAEALLVPDVERINEVGFSLAGTYVKNDRY